MAAAAVVLLAVVPAPPAGAHGGGDPAVRVVLDVAEPPLPAGVLAQVRPGVVDQVVLENRTAEPLVVEATGGEDFLRLGPDGAEVNLASPDWYSTNAPEGVAPVPPDVVRDRGRGRPRFARVARDPAWGWFDHRLHPEGAAVPGDVREAGRDAVLAQWSIPLRHGARRHTLRGRVLYAPPRGQFRVDASAAPAGLELTALQGRLPGLFLAPPGGAGAAEVVVLGRAGEPFLRFAGGRVEANTRSASWFDDQRARGRPVQPPADGAPVWEQVSSGPAYGWLDVRLQYPRALPPRPALARDTPTEVSRWEVPVLVGGRRAALTGAVTWVPVAAAEAALRPAGRPDGTRASLAAAAVVTGAAALLAALLLARRRRWRRAA